jgi:hypothetical protein
MLAALLSVALCVAVALSEPQQAAKPQTPREPFEKAILPILDKYCISCHQGEDAFGGIDLAKFRTKEAMIEDRELWEKVARAVQTKVMPPRNRPAPADAERNKFVEWIEKTIAEECGVREPGRVTMRRLNRLEYNNTIRDLTGLDLRLADDFPSDDVGHGFDNIGDVLSISPLLMEKYLKAAEIAANRVITVPSDRPLRQDGSSLRATGGSGATLGTDQMLNSNGELYLDLDVRIPGEHRIRVGAWGQQAGDEVCKMQIRIGGRAIRTVDVAAVQRRPEVYEAVVELPAGRHRIGAAFINDFYQAGPPARDRNLAVQFIEVVRPTAGRLEDMPEAHRRVITELPTAENREAVSRKLLGDFARRAFRRPAEPQELDRLMQLVNMAHANGEPFERGMQLGVQAILSSPHFLFRVETDNGPGPIGAHELASRLSYFLWSSMPDDELNRLADSGRILRPQVLDIQVERMLKDPKAKALGEAFATQWLTLRMLALSQPDTSQFKDFDEGLRTAMLTETKMFFDNVVAEDRPVTDFLDGKYTFINERLARLYGVSGVSGETFRRVSLEGTPRQGILTQASVLTLTSNPTRTSPVKRGKWVLENILNQPPPPPPPGVPDLIEHEEGEEKPKTLREQMQRHLKDAICASCHVRMDPIGLSLENFDAIGRWRDADAAGPIDASGELPDGTKFAGPTELSVILLAKKDTFAKAIAEKMLTFATGRGMAFEDRCHVDEVADKLAADGYRFSALVKAVVTSEPFRMRS